MSLKLVQPEATPEKAETTVRLPRKYTGRYDCSLIQAISADVSPDGWNLYITLNQYETHSFYNIPLFRAERLYQELGKELAKAKAFIAGEIVWRGTVDEYYQQDMNEIGGCWIELTGQVISVEKHCLYLADPVDDIGMSISLYDQNLSGIAMGATITVIGVAERNQAVANGRTVKKAKLKQG